jgi:hypothetical protein
VYFIQYGKVEGKRLKQVFVWGITVIMKYGRNAKVDGRE